MSCASVTFLHEVRKEDEEHVGKRIRCLGYVTDLSGHWGILESEGVRLQIDVSLTECPPVPPGALVECIGELCCVDSDVIPMIVKSNENENENGSIINKKCVYLRVQLMRFIEGLDVPLYKEAVTNLRSFISARS